MKRKFQNQNYFIRSQEYFNLMQKSPKLLRRVTIVEKSSLEIDEGPLQGMTDDVHRHQSTNPQMVLKSSVQIHKGSMHKINEASLSNMSEFDREQTGTKDLTDLNGFLEEHSINHQHKAKLEFETEAESHHGHSHSHSHGHHHDESEESAYDLENPDKDIDRYIEKCKLKYQKHKGEDKADIEHHGHGHGHGHHSGKKHGSSLKSEQGVIKMAPSNQAFMKTLTAKIKKRMENQVYDMDLRRFPATAQCVNKNQEQYDFNCLCNVCQKHLKKLKLQDPSMSSLKVQKKEESSFQTFLKKDLNPENKVRLPNQAELDIEEERILQEIKDGKIDYLRDIKRNNKNLIKPVERYVYMPRGNQWLLMNLLPPSENVLGCELNIPEQLIVDNGKPKAFIKTDKENGCIQQVFKQKTNIKDAIYQLITLCNDRRKAYTKDQEDLQKLKQHKETQKPNGLRESQSNFTSAVKEYNEEFTVNSKNSKSIRSKSNTSPTKNSVSFGNRNIDKFLDEELLNSQDTKKSIMKFGVDYLDDCNCSPSRAKKWSVNIKRGNSSALNDPKSPSKLTVKKSSSALGNPMSENKIGEHNIVLNQGNSRNVDHQKSKPYGSFKSFRPQKQKQDSQQNNDMSETIGGQSPGTLKSGKTGTQGSPNRNNRSRGKSESKKQQREQDMFVLGPKDFYQDNFIIKFKDTQYIEHNGQKLEIQNSRVLSKDEFEDEIRQYRPNNPFWETISSVQLAPISKVGMGRLIKFCFTPMYIEKSELFKKEDKQNLVTPKASDLNKFFTKDPKQNKMYNNLAQKLEGLVEFDYKQFGEDDATLQVNNPFAYCLKMCNKIGYFMQFVHEIDIIRMNVEFYQDETGSVHFYNATNIWIRCLESNKELNQPDTQLIQKELMESLQREIQKKMRSKDQGISKQIKYEAALFKRYQLKKMLTQVLDDLQVANYENDETNLLEIMAEFNDKLDVFNKINHQQMLQEAKTRELSQQSAEALKKKQTLASIRGQRSSDALEKSKSVKSVSNSKYNTKQSIANAARSSSLIANSMSRRITGHKSTDKIQSVKFEQNHPDSRNSNNFFKHRNLKTNRSAMDHIGILGEVESRAKVTDGDPYKYYRYLEKKRDSTNKMFDDYRNRFNKEPLRNLGNSSLNMLEMIRSKEDLGHGKDNFLIPLTKKKSIQHLEILNDISDSYQQNSYLKNTFKRISTIPKLNSTRNAKTALKELEPMKISDSTQIEEQVKTQTHLSKNTVKYTQGLEMLIDQESSILQSGQSQKSLSVIELERINQIKNQESEQGSDVIPAKSDQRLVFPSNRPLGLKQNVLKTLLYKSSENKSKNLLSQRVNNRLQFNEKMKVMEEAAKSVDDIKPIDLLNKNIIDTNEAPKTQQIQNEIEQFQQQPVRMISFKEEADKKDEVFETQKDSPKYIINIQKPSITPKTNLDTQTNSVITGVKSAQASKLFNLSHSPLNIDKKLQKKFQKKTQKQLNEIQSKIKKSQKSLMESKIPEQHEYYNLKDPATFKQWLNIGSQKEVNSAQISRVVNRVTKNINSTENKGSGMLRFYGKSTIQMMSAEQLGNNQQRMLRNIETNLFNTGERKEDSYPISQIDINRSSMNDQRSLLVSSNRLNGSQSVTGLQKNSKMHTEHDYTNRSLTKTNAVTKRTADGNPDEYLTGLSNFHEYQKPDGIDQPIYGEPAKGDPLDIFAQTFNNINVKPSIFDRKIPKIGTAGQSRNQHRLDNQAFTQNDSRTLTTQGNVSSSGIHSVLQQQQQRSLGSSNSSRIQRKVHNQDTHPKNFGLIEKDSSVLSQEQYDEIAEKIKIQKQDKIFGVKSLKKEYGYFKHLKKQK